MSAASRWARSAAGFVAQAVAAAIEGRPPRLRCFVGVDGQHNLAGRAKRTDQQWIALHGSERTGGFFARGAQICGSAPSGSGDETELDEA